MEHNAMKIKSTSKRKKVSRFFVILVISILTIVMVMPLIWLLSASLQTVGDIYKVPFNWIPKALHFENLKKAWKVAQMDTAFFSSACVSLIYLACHLCFCTLIGFVFAKYQFKGKNFLFTLVLATMMIPQELTFFPVYGIIKKLHLIDTYLGAALPLMISGMGVFMMRQFSVYIPNEILEAAKMDGCGNLRSFLHVGLPLLKPGLASLSVLAFSYIWDEFAWSRLVLNSNDHMTLPITLVNLMSASSLDVDVMSMLAASVITILPVLILFVIFQKQFIASIAQSGVKG